MYQFTMQQSNNNKFEKNLGNKCVSLLRARQTGDIPPPIYKLLMSS